MAAGLSGHDSRIERVRRQGFEGATAGLKGSSDRQVGRQRGQVGRQRGRDGRQNKMSVATDKKEGMAEHDHLIV